MSSLFNREPLVVNVELAEAIGLNESIIVQQLHYWIEKNKNENRNYRDGRFWTYNTIQEWRDKNFRFWSVDTVKRILSSLEKLGFVLSGNFNASKMDRTKWYTVNYEALDAVVETKKPEKPRSGALVQNAPMQEGKLPQSISADCPDALGQIAPSNTRDLLTEITTEISTEEKQEGQIALTVESTPKKPKKSSSKSDKPKKPSFTEIVEEFYAAIPNAEKVKGMLFDYIEMRKEKGFFVSTSLRLCLKTLFELAPNDLEAQYESLKHAVETGYTKLKHPDEINKSYRYRKDPTATRNPFLRLMEQETAAATADVIDITPQDNDDPYAKFLMVGGGVR
jgi:hypothetical protein